MYFVPSTYFKIIAQEFTAQSFVGFEKTFEKSSKCVLQVKDRKCKEGTFSLNLKGLKAQKKKKPPDCTGKIR